MTELDDFVAQVSTVARPHVSDSFTICDQMSTTPARSQIHHRSSFTVSYLRGSSSSVNFQCSITDKRKSEVGKKSKEFSL